MVRAAFRKAARVWGALPDRVRQASSRQVRSRTWCRRFSIPQCPRAMLSNEAASASSRDRLVMAQAGDGVHDLDAVLAAQAASSLDAADLAQTRPLAEIGGEALAALQASDLDAAVPLLDRLDPSSVRRGRPLRRGGNPAGRPGRCRLPASAGCS